MKKIASMFLAFAMMLSLVACGGGEQQSNASENSGKIDTSATESTGSESKDSENNQVEEFTFEEVPSDLDDIDSTLEGIFNTNDSLTDDTAIYNKYEENNFSDFSFSHLA